ncbi:hypothetical protein [Rhodomicrobium lacus]|uniref:hypothetical protein n=1 Tax=Rhodomicrobium lacus TaxID=2498452 RepID=UPI0026E1E1A9|nr:hypothetical protein [Rhodomicrobium lacus]WKW52175.1 hypothetical protein QMO75_06780 [Rhodomicrobium lacus]
MDTSAGASATAPRPDIHPDAAPVTKPQPKYSTPPASAFMDSVQKDRRKGTIPAGLFAPNWGAGTSGSVDVKKYNSDGRYRVCIDFLKEEANESMTLWKSDYNRGVSRKIDDYDERKQNALNKITKDLARRIDDAPDSCGSLPPEGWVKCSCGEEHRAFGAMFGGSLWHPEGPKCQHH